MRRVLLGAALWLGVGPALVQSAHALSHDVGLDHIHHHDDSADHGERDDDHGGLPSFFALALTSHAPRLDPFVGAALPVPGPAVAARPKTVPAVHGPPESPPGSLVRPVPADRAPPA